MIFFKSRPHEIIKKPLTNTDSFEGNTKDNLQNNPTIKATLIDDQVSDKSQSKPYSLKSSCRMLKILFNDKLYRFAFLFMFFGYGNLSTQAALMTEIFTSYGLTEDSSTTFGAMILAIA